jgi:hypothetical protein
MYISISARNDERELRSRLSVLPATENVLSVWDWNSRTARTRKETAYSCGKLLRMPCQQAQVLRRRRTDRTGTSGVVAGWAWHTPSEVYQYRASEGV